MLRFWLFLGLCFWIFTTSGWAAKRYVGSQVCADCHAEEYQSYQKYAKKAHSFASVKKMSDHLAPAELRRCYRCHTTGYGEPGGFVDEKTTPALKNVGCEACHGPGSAHVESEDPKDIRGTGEQIRKVCVRCHTKERVEAFRFRPLLYGGAH